MLSSLKQIAVLSITTFYVLQLCMLFSGALIENIQQLRHQNQIAKTLLAEQKEISLKEWGKLENKKEIKINETFYDVISFKIVSKKVIILAVKDDFEREIRISIRNLFGNYFK